MNQVAHREKPDRRALLVQLLRFGLVGVVNTTTTYLIVRWLAEPAGVPAASAVGYAAGVAQSFLLNRFWTFSATRSQAEGRWGREMLRFIAVNIACGGLFTAVNTLVAPQLGLTAGILAGVALVTPLGFILNRFIVFR
jgi:putative flippase GtrA